MKKPTALIFSCLVLVDGACSRSSQSGAIDQDYDALKKEAITCDLPARAEMRPWGKTGKSNGCYVRSGPFIAAENGYVHLRGQFKEGKEVGVWRWYDKQGNVVKEIDYSTDQTKSL